LLLVEQRPLYRTLLWLPCRVRGGPLGSFINIRASPCVSLAEADNFLLFLALIECSWNLMFWPCFSFLSSLEFCARQTWLTPCHSQRERESWESWEDECPPQIIHCGRGKQGASSDARITKTTTEISPTYTRAIDFKASIE